MRVPVCIVTGFLGAGKTTLVRQLLDTPHGPKTGLILNEIGEAGIDTGFELSQAFVELKDRCACCVQSADLQAAIDTVLNQTGIERIILETTGLADPLGILWRLQADARLQVEAVVTLIDPTADAAYSSVEWQQQVSAADILIISKQDIATHLPLDEVRQHNRHARIIAPHLLADVLLEGDLNLAERNVPSFAPLVAKHSDWRGTVVTSDRLHTLDRVEDWLETLPEDVFRAKGIVKTEQGFIGFQLVAGRTDLDLNAAPPPHGETRVAFFGRRIDTQALEQSFRGTAG